MNRLSLATAALAVTVGLAACGGSSHASTSTNANATTNTSTGSNGSAPGSSTGAAPASFPGATGSVAAISGQSMEVQNQQDGQVTVSWTPSTRFSQMVTVPASAVVVGDCVTVNGAPSNGAIVATGVTISQPSSSGSCTRGFPGGGQRPPGTFRNRTGTTRPAGGAGANFGFASGKVTAVAASTLTVDGFSSAGFRPGSSSSTPTTTPTAKSVTVDLKSTTTYRTDRAAAASNLAVGDCVTATGSSSSNGSVAASVIRITSTGGQACTAGFGRFGGGGGNPGGSLPNG